MRRNHEFIRIFDDYSCTFASIRGQFENAEEEGPQMTTCLPLKCDFNAIERQLVSEDI
jgi:hypothetical protein